MLSLFRKIFRVSRQERTQGPRRERREIDFSNPRQVPFELGEEERYTAGLKDGSLCLELRRERLLAWSECDLGPYADLALDAELRLDCPAEQGVGRAREGESGPSDTQGSPTSPADPVGLCSAVGFLFRFQDDSSFYSVMVSPEGFYRFDLIFNGSPRAIIGWTECPKPIDGRLDLKIYARGSRFCFLINFQWVGEAEDDSLESGGLAFAAQNFGPQTAVSAYLDFIAIESRPIELETDYLRLSQHVPPKARYQLAETLFAMGKAQAAAVQLHKQAQAGELDRNETLLLCRAKEVLGLDGDAESLLNQGLIRFPDDAELSAEKAVTLYRQSRFMELREWLLPLLSKEDQMGQNPLLRNLLGHAQLGSGQLALAAESYQAAFDLDRDQGLYALHSARAWLQAGESHKALEMAQKAASAFMAADSLGDQDECLALMRDIDPLAPSTKALEAKILYREGRLVEAAQAFEDLLSAGQADASIYYLSALPKLAAMRTGQAEALLAIERLRKACELEPAFALYRFRLAEALHLLGQDCHTELSQALERSPDDGWTHNLAAQICMERLDTEGAQSHIKKALAALPNELEIRINQSAIALTVGATAEALSCLDGFSDSARSLNQRGNVLAASGQLEAALKEYDRALRMAPRDHDILCNRAACLFELERFSDAEDDLRRALSQSQSPRALSLIGRLADLYGDYPRAEAAFKAALEASGGRPDCLMELARLYLDSRRFSEAEESIRSLEALSSPQAGELRRRLNELAYEQTVCATCGREWLSPRNLGPQAPLRLRGELPDHSPAGACPRCGKVYCVGCRKESLVDDRLTCPDCGVPLKLGDGKLCYLVREITGLA